MIFDRRNPGYFIAECKTIRLPCSMVAPSDIVELATASPAKRRDAMRLIFLAAAACLTFAFANTHARADGAWCSRDALGCTNCGFHTYAQCQANVSGMGGSCERNLNRVASSEVRGRKQRNN